MKLIFVSNYFNHHQLPFCDALYELLEGDFCFLQTQPMEEERVKMGWQAEERPYVSYAAKNSCAHKSGVEKMPGSESNSNAVTDAEEFEKLLFTADVVIFGGCDEESYIQERLTAGKPIFRYNERLYKEGQWKAVSPRGLLQKYRTGMRFPTAPDIFYPPAQAPCPHCRYCRRILWRTGSCLWYCCPDDKIHDTPVLECMQSPELHFPPGSAFLLINENLHSVPPPEIVLW